MNNNGLFRNLDNYTRNSRNEFEDKLATLVETPSISSDPERVGDISRCGEIAAQYLNDLGARAEIVPTPGYPVVFGSLITDPKNPTVTIYNHLDVQPADASEWNRSAVYFLQGGRPLRRPRDDRRQRSCADRDARCSVRRRKRPPAQISNSSGSSKKRSARRISNTSSSITRAICKPIRSSSPTRSGFRASSPPSLRTARFAGLSLQTGDACERRAFRAGRRSGAQPHRRTGPGRQPVLRREDGQGENTRLLRGCGSGHKGRG